MTLSSNAGAATSGEDPRRRAVCCRACGRKLAEGPSDCRLAVLACHGLEALAVIDTTAEPPESVRAG